MAKTASELHFEKVAKALGMRIGTQDYNFAFNPSGKPKAVRDSIAKEHFQQRLMSHPQYVYASKNIANGNSPYSVKKELFGKSSAKDIKEESDEQENADERENISKALYSVFGGKELTRLSRAFGITSIGGTIGRLAKWFALDNPLEMSRVAIQTRQLSELSGVDVNNLSGMGYALQQFGGDKSNAASLYTRMNELVQGAKYGKIPEMFKTLQRRFGISYLNGGKIVDAETMIKRISQKLANTRDIGKKAYIARIAQLSGPEFDLLKDGPAEYERRKKEALEGSPFTYGGQKHLDELSENLGRLSSEFEKFRLSFAPSINPLIKFIADYFNHGNVAREDNRKINASGDKIYQAMKEAGYRTGEFRGGEIPGVSGDFAQRMKFFNAIHKLGIEDEAKLMWQYSDATGQWMKNYDSWKKWRTEYDTPRAPMPIEDYSSKPLSVPTFYDAGDGQSKGNLNLRLDFGDLDSKLSPATKSAFDDAGALLLHDIAPQIFMGEH